MTATPPTAPPLARSADRVTVPVARLRLGLYVHLDLGWLDHPFSRNRFMLDDPAQIETLRRLGVTTVQVLPDLCDPVVWGEVSLTLVPTAAVVDSARPAPASAELDAEPDAEPEVDSPAAAATQALSAAVAAVRGEARADANTDTPDSPTTPRHPALTPRVLRGSDPALARRRAELAAQRDSLTRSERAHAQASRAWLGVMRDALAAPQTARQGATALAAGLVDELLGDPHTTVRLLGEATGTAASQHALNVSVLALLLGRSLGLDASGLQAVALGALVHDIGKLALPDHLRHADARNPALVLRERHEHVVQGVRLGMAMGLDAATLLVIAQHHEHHDGSGQPKGLRGEAISTAARVVGLVNAYDRLCNPHTGEPLRTPHEAQAQLFAHQRSRHDPAMLGAFIKLLGVYPPGSVVQLSDERLAMVVGVHPQHPMRPSVVVHDPAVPRDEALILHLQHEPHLGIRRSLHPQHLPRAVLDYLAPREAVSYAFAHGLEPVAAPADAARTA